jgi:arabinogalactan endo-1,4-beta-galactosidase
VEYQPIGRRGFNSIGLAAAAAAPMLFAGVAWGQPFFMGSDISLETFMQQQGVTFTDNGVAAPVDQILYNNGDNLFRLRLFVSPNTSYSATEGAIQTTTYDIALAQQIKADDPSAKIELDLHYSDTWADPGDQYIPALWAGETNAQLNTSLYNYTLNTLDKFKSAGVMPDIVQLGNEINNGMLWYPQGSSTATVGYTGEVSYTGTTAQQQASWAAFGQLINSGVAAVHAAQGAGPRTQISLVIGNGDTNGEPQYFFNTLTSPAWGNVPASSFDIMGVDFYPSTNDMSTLSSNMTALANTFNKKIMVMETAAPWETDKSLTFDPAYSPYTPANQAAYLSALATTVEDLPNNDGMGLMYWYPESVQIPGYSIYNGGATALFNKSYQALPAVSDFSITQHQWNTSASGSWSTSSNWTNSSPSGSDIEADFLGAIASGQTITDSSSTTLGTIRFENANTYTLSGTGSLTLLASLGWSYIVVQQGTQQINLPVTVASSAQFSVGAGCTLNLGGAVTVNSGQVLSPSGTGIINYQSSVTVDSNASMSFANSTNTPALTIAAGGSAAITGTGVVLQTSSLNNNGTLDVQNNELLINYGSSDPIASVRAELLAGFNNGTWNGSSGIVSSVAAVNANYGLGWADGADGVVAGLSSGQIEVKYTLLGDANLDGVVNGSDFSILAANFGTGATNWDQGNFLYASSVNGSDFSALAANFGLGANVTAADVAALDAFAAANGLLADVPEPGMMGLLAAAGMAGLARRRRVDARLAAR